MAFSQRRHSTKVTAAAPTAKRVSDGNKGIRIVGRVLSDGWLSRDSGFHGF